jgi:hypothetical protein
MKSVFLYIFLFCFFDKLASQQLVNGWKSIPLPKGTEAYQYNKSISTWILSLNSKSEVIADNKVATYDGGDSLPFKPYFDTLPPHFKGLRTVKKVSNGYLIGFNKGEFGGVLYWFSFSGDSSYIISKTIISHIFEVNSKIYIAHGLMHLEEDSGSINELTFDKGRWQIGNWVDLPSSPMVYLPIKDKIMIITSKAILTFGGLDNISYLKKDGFWNILFPHSALIKKDELYIGMHGGVFKINMKSGKEEWLIPR